MKDEISHGEGYGTSLNGVLAVPEDLIQSPIHRVAGSVTLDFDGMLSPPLVLHQDLSKGCGGQLWPAGMVLSRYLLRCRRDELQDKSMFVSRRGPSINLWV